MGEAKRRGSYDERVVDAILKREALELAMQAAREAREVAWNEKQAERRRVRQEEESRVIPKTPTRLNYPNRTLLAAAAIALASSSRTV